MAAPQARRVARRGLERARRERRAAGGALRGRPEDQVACEAGDRRATNVGAPIATND